MIFSERLLFRHTSIKQGSYFSLFWQWNTSYQYTRHSLSCIWNISVGHASPIWIGMSYNTSSCKHWPLKCWSVQVISLMRNFCIIVTFFLSIAVCTKFIRVRFIFASLNSSTYSITKVSQFLDWSASRSQRDSSAYAIASQWDWFHIALVSQVQSSDQTYFENANSNSTAIIPKLLYTMSVPIKGLNKLVFLMVKCICVLLDQIGLRTRQLLLNQYIWFDHW